MLKGQPGDPGDRGVPGSLGPRGMPVRSWNKLCYYCLIWNEVSYVCVCVCVCLCVCVCVCAVFQGEDGRDGYGLPGPDGAKVEETSDKLTLSFFSSDPEISDCSVTLLNTVHVYLIRNVNSRLRLVTGESWFPWLPRSTGEYTLNREHLQGPHLSGRWPSLSLFRLQTSQICKNCVLNHSSCSTNCYMWIHWWAKKSKPDSIQKTVTLQKSCLNSSATEWSEWLQSG